MISSKFKIKLKKSKVCCICFEYLLKFISILGLVVPNKFEKYRGKRKAFFLLSPTHGNLGDNAIAYATKEFIKDNCKDIIIIELTIMQSMFNIRKIKNVLCKDDIVLLHGGGNIGDMYKVEEYSRRLIISQLKNTNKIISMPQTMSFSSSVEGKKEYRRTQKVYCENKNLVLTVRERTTYQLMKEAFPSIKVIFTPDIVLYIDKTMSNIVRNDILICLRNDEEGIISNQVRKEIVKHIKSNFKNVKITDTVINEAIPLSDRDEKLESIWNRFRASKIVITDRLHGMIFCAITATPCIVLKTFNHKVIESYDWLKDCEYIKMAKKNDPKYIIDMMNELLNDSSERKKQDFTINYKELINCLKN